MKSLECGGAPKNRRDDDEGADDFLHIHFPFLKFAFPTFENAPDGRVVPFETAAAVLEATLTELFGGSIG